MKWTDYWGLREGPVDECVGGGGVWWASARMVPVDGVIDV